MNLADNQEDSFAELCSLFEELSSDSDAFFKLDAFTIRKLCTKKGLNSPSWFNGIVRGLEKTHDKMQFKKMWLSLSEHAEMASHYKMSLARAKIIAKTLTHIEQFHFPTCGIGLDALNWLSSEQLNISSDSIFTISDIDPLISRCANYNFSKYFPDKTKVLCHDILDPLPIDLNHIHSYCFADPSRRKDGAKFSRGEYQPELPALITKLEQYTTAQIKLSASENIDELVEQYPNWHWSINALARDIKEIFGTRQKNGIENFENTKSMIISDKDSENTFHASCEQMGYLPTTRNFEKYIYLPHPALICAKLSDSWIKKHNYPFKRNDIFYTSDQSIKAALFDGYETIDQCALRPKSLKKLIQPFSDHNIEIINPGKALIKTDIKTLEQCLPKKKAKQKALKLIPIYEGKKAQCFLLRQLSFCDPHYIA